MPDNSTQTHNVDSREDKIQTKPTLKVVLYWHMHQPEYRDLQTGEFQLPWTYLHTIKDYVDMVAHLENNPQAQAVINFAPVLLEQIEDYAKQFNDFFAKGSVFKDPLLVCLSKEKTTFTQAKQKRLIKTCQRANKERLIDNFKPFKELIDMANAALEKPSSLTYYSDQFFADILVWYHLAWMGETVRRTDPRIKALLDKSRHFDHEDRLELLRVISDLMNGVIARYKVLAKSGRIELSMTPASHPIVPLLIDLESAKEAMPFAPMPTAKNYPGGEQRSLWQMQQGLKIFKKHFGFTPQGCWPSEGSISEPTIELVNKMGMKWLASGETVLRNSLVKSGIDSDPCMHKTYQYKDNEIACFFRDDGLSDLIGFKYSNWHADDAVANLISHLEDVATKCIDKDDAIISIILDGENAWEYYPFNGYYFLDTLYKKLSEHQFLEMTTYSQHIKKYSPKTTLNNIVAGSWVYGTFSTWIGEADKNTAWDMLVEAKMAYDKAIASKMLTKQEISNAEIQLATCESSDWFWWFGAYNSSESVAAFDQQYRLHLANLYRLIKSPEPESLSKAFSFGTRDASSAGVMLPGKQS